jgi:SAM-dependent methyltransferase
MNPFESEVYLRERWSPDPGDRYYLHFTDLLVALKRLRVENLRSVLDFGCGGSPYRGLFSDALYLRADLPGRSGIDHEIRDGGVPSLASGAVESVLSSQVLEHVPSPEKYLRECHRVLVPGGRLILSTHGFFEEHACPTDYYRWTGDGLRLLLENNGFAVERVYKLTTQARFVAHFLQSYFYLLKTGRKDLAKLGIAVADRGLRRFLPSIHRWLDTQFAAHGVVEEPAPRHDLYLGLLVDAVKT